MKNLPHGLWDAFLYSLSENHPPTNLTIAISLLISLPLLSPILWPTTRNLITVIHELGHALVAVLFGRRTKGIKINSDTSGVTITRGKPYGLGVIFTALAGYTSPPLFAALLVWLVMSGYSSISVFVLMILLFLMLLFIRNFWGLLVVGVSIVALYFFATAMPRDLHAGLLLSVAFFMLIGGIISIIELHIKHIRGDAQGSDAWQLQQNFILLPPAVWILFFYVTAIVSVTLVVDFIFQLST